MKRTLQLIYTAEFLKLSYKLEIVVFALVNLSGFLIPFLLGSPQILIGTIVNSLIFYSAIEFKSQKILPILFFPSVAVFLRGMIFGPLTYFLVILIPFIWAANSIQLFSMRYFMLRKKNMAVSMLFASIAKAAFLFAVTFVFVAATNMPRIFLLAMGPIQLITAVLGGGIVFGISRTSLLKEQGKY